LGRRKVTKKNSPARRAAAGDNRFGSLFIARARQRSD
jgi:hypothetical protein